MNEMSANANIVWKPEEITYNVAPSTHWTTTTGKGSVTTTTEEQKKTIGVFWSNRSEEGLLRPVIEQLKKAGFEVTEYKCPDTPYEVIDYLQSLDIPLPDYALVPYDRPPMTMVAFLAYHCRIPIIQLHAGDISTGTLDDRDRWVISMWADYHFCAGKTQAKRVKRYLWSMGRDPSHVYISGVTNLDDIDKISEPPDGDYDVVAYNVPTSCPEKMSGELEQILNTLDKETYWIEPQGNTEDDKYILSRARDFATTTGKPIHVVPTMPHESMLGLFSRAKRVIGNSSALFFEAPYFGCQIVQVGERNKVRENVELSPGGSKRIAKKLKKWLA